MERRDFNYYEANAADISLEKITSSEKNAKVLRRLRDGDDNLTCFILGSGRYFQFRMGKGDDLGWLGYFIGRSVKKYSNSIFGLFSKMMREGNKSMPSLIASPAINLFEV